MTHYDDTKKYLNDKFGKNEQGQLYQTTVHNFLERSEKTLSEGANKNVPARMAIYELAKNLADLQTNSDKLNLKDPLQKTIHTEGHKASSAAKSLAQDYLEHYNKMPPEEQKKTLAKIESVSNNIKCAATAIKDQSARNIDALNKQTKESCQLIQPKKSVAKKMFKALAIAGTVLFAASCIAAAVPTGGASLALLAVPAKALVVTLSAPAVAKTLAVAAGVSTLLAFPAGYAIATTSAPQSDADKKSLSSEDKKEIKQAEGNFTQKITQSIDSIRGATKKLSDLVRDTYQPPKSRESVELKDESSIRARPSR